MSDRLSNDLATLLDAERERPGPTPAESKRLLTRLDASIGALPDSGPHHGGGGDGGGSAPLSSGGIRWMHPLAIATTSLAVGLGGGVALDRAVRPPPPPRVVYVDRVVDAAQLSAVESAASTSPAADTSGAPAPPPRASAPAASSGRDRDRELAAERALLEVARTALVRNDPAAALTALDRHAQRSPAGQLREEREALAVQALAALGHEGEARARADRFKKAYPSSMFMTVIDTAVGAAR